MWLAVWGACLLPGPARLGRAAHDDPLGEARQHVHGGDLDAAVAAYQRALAAMPDRLDPYIELAKVYVAGGDPAAGISFFRSWSESHPSVGK